MTDLPIDTALLIIDMQLGFDDPQWGARNNPDAEQRVAALIDVWRSRDARVIHVHHDSPGSDGLLRPGTPGNLPKPETRPIGDEPVYRKSVNSAFIGTRLNDDLRRMGVQTLVLAGLTTNHCVSTTARMAGNLGFQTFVAPDATAAFDRSNLDGRLRMAADVHDAALSDLHGEFAEVTSTSELIAAFTKSDLRRGTHG